MTVNLLASIIQSEADRRDLVAATQYLSEDSPGITPDRSLAMNHGSGVYSDSRHASIVARSRARRSHNSRTKNA